MATLYIERYSKYLKLPSRLVKTFHGRKYWSNEAVIRAPAIEYSLARGLSINDAMGYAKGLIEQLTNFHDPTTLNVALYNAQVTGNLNPFVSTSRSRHVARSFATSDGKPGFIVTIQAPEEVFFDFNLIRNKTGIPDRPEFQWLEELGVPFFISQPFEIVQVDRVLDVHEDADCVFKKE